ncbi:MAG: biotin-dependent carboxyltransferase family protein [Thermodesulfobacteriota bacterium]|nr:biotin-dependent carboxyltransferase family protein [Thermodesulfobacteriota bacterium]
MKVFRIIEPGSFTTVQDRGRYGFQQFGVPLCGMLDVFAGEIANILVGNFNNEALLEFTFLGGTLEVINAVDIALAGGNMEATINGKAVENWSSHNVLPGDIIRLNQVKKGCRAYLGITGGIDVPIVMGSRSCYTGAKIGGFKGRVLASGDILTRGDKEPLNKLKTIPEKYIPRYGSNIVLRAIPGPQKEYFDSGMETFFNSCFTVSNQANRMGYRLNGNCVKQKKSMPKSIISEPSLPGGVQIPEDGQPIILLAEQTVGGYTKIATVISTDISKIAQAMPGDKISFKPVTLQQAHKIYRKRKKFFQKLQNIDLSIKSMATMGKEFFNSEFFQQKIEEYMLQI